MPEKLSFDEFAKRYCEKQEQTPDGLLHIFQHQRTTYQPDGWVLLECQDFSSSMLGSFTILPYGPNSTYKVVPEHPISPRGRSNDTSTVVAILEVKDLP